MRRKVRIWPLIAGALGLLAASTLVPWFGARRSRGFHSELPPPPYTFPKDFLFGAATASHQIERGARSDWTAFENEVMKHGRFGSLGPGRAQPGHIHDLGKWPDEVRRDKTAHDVYFADDLAAAAPVFSIQGTFSIEYVLAEDAPESSQEAIDAFGEINGRFNLTAYWREYAQSCFARAGLPAVEIPPYNEAKGLETLRQHEAEKVKADTSR